MPVSRHQFRGLPYYSSHMHVVMEQVYAAHADGRRFTVIALDGVSQRAIGKILHTLSAKRDWIVMSKGKDGITRYAITGRGLAAYAEYTERMAALTAERDRTCPHCHKRQRAQNSDGTWRAYCKPCNAAAGKRRAVAATFENLKRSA